MPTYQYTILGIGISGTQTIRYLLRTGANLFVSDPKPSEALSTEMSELLAHPSVQYELGVAHSQRCLDCECIIVSPSIPTTHAILEQARQRSVEILTEVELASRQVDRWVGITGSNGKSTTTAMLAHLTGGIACGNIGVPFVQALMEHPGQLYSCELSSYMLAHSRQLQPHVAIITNLTPDHVAWHGSVDRYYQDKLSITQHQNNNNWLIIPDNLPQQPHSTANVLYVCTPDNTHPKYPDCIYQNGDGQIVLRVGWREQRICASSQVPLPGPHNLANAMCAISAAHLIKPDLPIDLLASRLESFRGLEHRIEFIREFNGQKFYNDSKATNPESTITALRAFGEPIVLLLGGRDKLTDLSELVRTIEERVSEVFLFGEASSRFHSALQEHRYSGQIHCVPDLETAVTQSLQADGRIVLLSPACASFDQFRDFEHRGQHMKNLVNNLN